MALPANTDQFDRADVESAEEAYTLILAGPMLYEAFTDEMAWGCPQSIEHDHTVARCEEIGAHPETVHYEKFLEAWDEADEAAVIDHGFHESDESVTLNINVADVSPFEKALEAYIEVCADQRDDPNFPDGSEQDRYFWGARERRLRDVLDRAESHGHFQLPLTYTESYAVRQALSARLEHSHHDGLDALVRFIDAALDMSDRFNEVAGAR